VVTGQREDTTVVERRGTLSFQPGRTVVWRVELLAECVDEDCDDDETCDRGGCRSQEILPGELTDWNGNRPPLDAGPFDACVAEERCSGRDDDCDGSIDEGFDLQVDM